MHLVDTHCHIHSLNYELDADEVIKEAAEEGVNGLICVGTDLEDSRRAVEFVQSRNNTWASIGLHPHESKNYVNNPESLKAFEELADQPSVIAVGECGLDYYYNHSHKDDQREVLEFQLDLASRRNLPVIFHVRSAFEDFWPIFDNFPGIQGVIHSFTAGRKILDQALSRNLMVGLNGILTFTKDQAQLDAAKLVPIENIILETDSPFLTPVPFRGMICQPKYVRATAEFLAELRQIDVDQLARQTSDNVNKLFKVKVN